MTAVIFTPVTTQTLASGEDSPHSTATLSGALFVGLLTSPGKLLKWASPSTDLTTYTVLTFGTNENYVNSMVVTGGFIYIAHNGFFDGGVTNRYCINVSKVDPSAMTKVNLVKINTGSLSNDPGLQINVATDGTYLYVLTAPTSSDAVIYKVQLSDGSVIGSVTITGRQFGHTIVYDTTTAKLYFGGSTPGTPRTCWTARVDPALTGLVDLTVHSANSAIITDDSAIVGSEYWVALEGVSIGNVKRVALDMSGYIDVLLGSVQLYGVIYDSPVVWVPTATSPGSVIALATDGSVLGTSPLADNLSNEWQTVGSNSYVTFFLTPGKVARGLVTTSVGVSEARLELV